MLSVDRYSGCLVSNLAQNSFVAFHPAFQEVGVEPAADSSARVRVVVYVLENGIGTWVGSVRAATSAVVCVRG